MKKKLLVVAGLIALATITLIGQNKEKISSDEKSKVILTTLDLIDQNYVYPDRVPAMRTYIQTKLTKGGYDSLSKLIPFLEAFERDIQQQANDTHLGMGLSPMRVKQILAENDETDTEITPEFLERMRFENFRLRKVERLDGNIGYLKFLNFAPLDAAKESLVGTMNFIRYSSAVVIDLTENGGGNSETMNFLLSYFLPENTQVSEFRYRKDGKIEKSSTVSDPAIYKFPAHVPVYILVSNKTSSAAEGFAYTLQQYKRARIVGEQTKGEGNPGQLFVINESLYIMIPTIEGINPVSKKSIDGVGVTPDLKVSQTLAFPKAMLEINRSLAASTQVNELKLGYKWQVPYWENQLNPEPLTDDIVQALIGNYEGGRKVLYENAAVYYVNTEGKKEKLEYMGQGIFQNAEKPFLRLVMPGTDKQVQDFKWTWDDGGDPQVVKRVR